MNTNESLQASKSIMRCCAVPSILNLRYFILVSFRMDKAEQVAYNNASKVYIEQNKLRQLFYSFTKLLCSVQPADPIKFLIEHLQSSKKRRLIYVQGFEPTQNTELASLISNKFNFKLIDLRALLKVKDVSQVDDQTMNSTFKQAGSKVESVYKGIVVSGYPNNRIQANFLQQNAFFPERIFVLPYNNETMEKYYLKEGFSPEEAQMFVIRDNLNIKELKQILKGIPDWLPENIQQVNEIVISTLKVKDKKTLPIESPRILVLHPPYLQPAAIKEICSKYCFNLVTLEQSFLKLKSRKQDYEKYVRKHQTLSNELQLALIQTESTTIQSKNKGLVISGWPRDLKMHVFAQQHFIAPHIVLIFFDEKEKIVKQFEALDANDHTIFPIKPKPSVEEFRTELLAYDKLIVEAKKSQKAQSYMLSEQPKEILRSFESLIANPKLYS